MNLLSERMKYVHYKEDMTGKNPGTEENSNKTDGAISTESNKLVPSGDRARFVEESD